MAKLSKANIAGVAIRKAAATIENLGDDPVIGPNVTIECLIDDYAVLAAAENAIKKAKELHKTLISARNSEGKTTLKGEAYLIKISSADRTNFSKDQALKHLTEEQAAECYSTTKVDTWKAVSLED